MYYYNLYSTKSNSTNFRVCAVIIALALILASIDNAVLLGTLGCCLAVIVMGSPLATLRTVIRDRCTASMPFNTSLMAWCNALSWTLYGLIIANDVMVRINKVI